MHETQPGPCAKQVVTATLITPDGERFVGTNYCLNPQTICPRNTQGFAPGEGYYLCKDVCKQVGHAEEIAVALAGPKAKGATIWVEGHPIAYAATGSGVCPNCSRILAEVGAVGVIGEPPV